MSARKGTSLDRLRAFLIGDGAVIAAGALFLFYVLVLRRKESYFRDDLWKEQARQKNQKSWLEDDARDSQIFLEYRLNPDEEDEITKPMRGPAPGSKPPTSKPKAKEAPKPEPEIRTPKFRGKPHEVLGVAENASVELINRAYKHWIKRYHPDRVNHLGVSFVEQARRRAEQLNTARQALLSRRKS